MKLSDSEGAGGEKEKHRQFDRELKNMISALTNMAAADKPGSSKLEEDDEHGVRIITLSGSNVGATMRSEIDDRNNKLAEGDKDDEGELDFLSTFVNSNFQAVNNSIMMGSKYETHDPGVHLDISSESERMMDEKAAKGRKGKDGVKSSHRQSEQTD